MHMQEIRSHVKAVSAAYEDICLYPSSHKQSRLAGLRACLARAELCQEAVEACWEANVMCMELKQGAPAKDWLESVQIKTEAVLAKAKALEDQP